MFNRQKCFDFLSGLTALAALQSSLGILAAAISFRLLVQYTNLAAFGYWSTISLYCLLWRLLDVTTSSAIIPSISTLSHQSQKVSSLLILLSLNFLFSISSLGLFNAAFALELYQQATYDIASNAFWYRWALVYFLAALPLQTFAANFCDCLARIKLRMLSTTAGSVVQIALVVILTPRLGAVGFCLSLIIASLLTSTVQICTVIFTVKGPLCLDRETIATARLALFSSGKFQVSAVLSYLSEPAAKYLMLSTGGTQFLALYELSSRVVTQLRNLVAALIQPLLPLFLASDFSERSSIRIRYRKLAITLSIYFLPAAIFGSCIFGTVVLRYFSWNILAMSTIIAVGFATNIATSWCHYTLLAERCFRPIIYSQAILSASVVAVGMGLHLFVGPYGIVLGVGVGLMLSSLFILISERVARARFANTRVSSDVAP